MPAWVLLNFLKQLDTRLALLSKIIGRVYSNFTTINVTSFQTHLMKMKIIKKNGVTFLSSIANTSDLNKKTTLVWKKMLFPNSLNSFKVSTTILQILLNAFNLILSFMTFTLEYLRLYSLVYPECPFIQVILKTFTKNLADNQKKYFLKQIQMSTKNG